MIGFWLDTRVGGHERWVYCDDSELMQIPDELLNCVCFVRGYRGGHDRIGTAFFHAARIPGVDDDIMVYVVTARHNVQPKDRWGPFKRITLWMNKHDGTRGEVEIPLEHWERHPTADVAVLPFAPPGAVWDYDVWLGDIVATQETMKSWYQGVGAEVMVPGLLTNLPGTPRLQPIVRVGNIAAFPKQPLQLETGKERSILIETRSIGGLSGSPVFLHLPAIVRDDAGNLRPFQPTAENPWGTGGAYYLLGLVHGFYKLGKKDPDGLDSIAPGALNTGLSVVVPVEKILDDIFNREDLMEKRKSDYESHQRGEVEATPAAGDIDESEFDRFEDLARQIVQVPKKVVNEKRKAGE